jgi:ribosomal protein S27E
MKCNRCGSVMVREKFYGPGGNFLGWRCIQCGEILDEVILENRLAGPGQHSRDRN